jgi:ribosomal protein L30/L7E
MLNLVAHRRRPEYTRLIVQTLGLPRAGSPELRRRVTKRYRDMLHKAGDCLLFTTSPVRRSFIDGEGQCGMVYQILIIYTMRHNP